MNIPTMIGERAASRVNLPSNSTRRTSADFARAITLAEFGWRNGKMLDQADFRDRAPGRFPALAPEARPR